MSPKISVLMSVYNGEKFLREAVDSILTQTFKDFEFVIVNDGSKDSTGEILASYRDHRLKIFSIENRGLPAALNYGLECCSADLVMRMDADDVAYPHRFAALLEDWEKAGRPDVFGSGADYINEDGLDLWGISMPLDNLTIKAEILAANGKMTIMHPTVLFRKKAVLGCGAYDPYFTNGQDYDLWLRMTLCCRFGNSPQHLLKFRFNSLSDTARFIHVTNENVFTGNWVRLLSQQKMILIEKGHEDLWQSHRDYIVGRLKEKVDVSRLVDEAIVGRLLTEAKILYCSGRKVVGIWQLLMLFLRNPDILLKRFMGIQIPDRTQHLLSPTEIVGQGGVR
jgi:glycosyltransferase involved in cell wall biosynthesis